MPEAYPCSMILDAMRYHNKSLGQTVGHLFILMQNMRKFAMVK